jgi:hypothetical protein
VAKPHKLLTPPASPAARRLPSEKEILEAADMVSFVFERPEAAALKKRFLEDAEAYRDWLRLQDQAEVRVIAYLLHLVLRCPQLLKRPPEFEWAMRELEEFLMQRRVDPRKDGTFWRAIELVRKKLRMGRPRDRALEFFRYGFIQNLMHPPRELQRSVRTLKKTKAVEQVAEAEQGLFGRSPDTRQIWRLYKRVDEFLRRIAARMQAESSPVAPLTSELDPEPRERVSAIKQGIKRSKRPKRVTRK